MAQNNSEPVIVVPAWRYQQLLQNEAKLEVTMEFLLESASLGYGNEELSFTDAAVRAVVKHADAAAYDDRVYELKCEKAKRVEGNYGQDKA